MRATKATKVTIKSIFMNRTKYYSHFKSLSALAKLFTFSYFLLLANTSQAQTNLDSLFSVWQDQTQSDSLRSSAYYSYIKSGYFYSQPDSALVLAEALHTYAKKHNFPRASMLGYSAQGIANQVLGNYPQALEYTQKSLVIEEELGYKKGAASSMGNIGLIYYSLGNIPLALENILKALAIYEEFGDEQSIAICLSNIAIIYQSQGNNIRALEYNESSLKIQEKLGNKKGIASSLANIGNIYSEQDQYSLAMQNYEKSLALMEDIGDKKGIAEITINIGGIYGKQENYMRAMEYYQKSLVMLNEIGDKANIGIVLQAIGWFHQEQGKKTLAVDYCQEALTLTKEIGFLEGQKNACECLHKSFKALGKSDKALEYYEQMISLRDSLFNEENTKKLVQIDMQHEFDRKEAVAKAEQDKKDSLALQEIKRQKLVRNGFMGGFAVVLFFAGVFFVQRNKIDKEKQRSEELLLNILPYEVAKELKEKGKADARDFELASILFTDFKGFTEESAKLSASELLKEINFCFEAFDGIMEKYGIEKIKTIGDAYMAAGGLPVPTDDSVKNTVLAALEMQTFIKERKAAKSAKGEMAFEMRVGIHTGPVVAGIVGVKKFQYDIWGDTVNTASRMESTGEVGQVNISQATYELLKSDPDFAFESRGKIAVKGKGEMEMYFVSINNNK